jgi:hypothetical protein
VQSHCSSRGACFGQLSPLHPGVSEDADASVQTPTPSQVLNYSTVCSIPTAKKGELRVLPAEPVLAEMSCNFAARGKVLTAVH